MTFEQFLVENFIKDRFRAAKSAVQSGIEAYNKTREEQQKMTKEISIKSNWLTSFEKEIERLRKQPMPDKNDIMNVFHTFAKTIPSGEHELESEELFRNLCGVLSRTTANCAFPNKIEDFPVGIVHDINNKKQGNVKRVLVPVVYDRGKVLQRGIVKSENEPEPPKTDQMKLSMGNKTDNLRAR